MSMNHIPEPTEYAAAPGDLGDPDGPGDPGDPSDPSDPGAPGPPSTAQVGETTSVAPPRVAPVLVEDLPRGLLFSLAAIPVGVALSIAIWKAGYVASISSLVMAALAVWLYTKGARTLPRRGLPVVIGVIVIGVVVSFFGIVAADLVDYYQANSGDVVVSEATFVMSNLTNGDILSDYAKDGAMLVGFAALGVFGTLRRLLAARRSAV